MLFMVAIFGVALPVFESNLLEQKKMLIAAETQTALSILQYYEQQANFGTFSVKMAQNLAINQIRQLRFGAEGKDYFWINDMQANMVMHPYRPDLEGQNLSNFSDPKGKLLFKEFVDVAKKDGAGYVQYYWQWKDNQKHIVPKISYVKLFKPWKWIIGTGVYIEDLRDEIAKLTEKLIFISVGILAIILLLSVYIIRNSLNEINKRMAAEKDLNSYKDGLEDLVEKRTAELKEAMSQVKILSGFLPICASCKKIRDDKGYWNQIESYIRDHSEAEFSHSICPDCAEKLYPDLYGKKRNNLTATSKCTTCAKSRT
ncbi:MAG: cache domain-containing protein [Desulfurivibrionaceae bacterium]